MPRSRVLVVEDEFLIRLILVEALTEAGYAVTEAGGGSEAIAILKGSAPFDLLVTDVQMPEPPDGIAVALQARSQFPAMPIIFATARPEMLRAFGELRPDDAAVQKPYNPETMMELVRARLPE